MRLSISSYSFAQYVNKGQVDILGVTRLVGQMGFDGIEFFGPHVWSGEEDASGMVEAIREECAAANIPIVSYTVGANFLKPAHGDWKDEVRRLEKEVAIAEALGVPLMRHDVAWGHPNGKQGLAEFIDVLPVLKQSCRAVTQFAEDHGVKTCTENHGFFIQDSERCATLIDEVAHPNFGALVDIGNFLCADEDPLLATRRMAPYAIHVHAKDFHVKPACSDPGTGWMRTRGGSWIRGSVIGHGNVDVVGCLGALRDAGYDGFVSIEFEGLEDCREAAAMGLENLRRYLGMA